MVNGLLLSCAESTCMCRVYTCVQSLHVCAESTRVRTLQKWLTYNLAKPSHAVRAPAAYNKEDTIQPPLTMNHTPGLDYVTYATMRS